MRAAKIACAFKHEGGISMENASGPIVESVTYSNDYKTATIKFKNVGDGLKTIDGSSNVKGFFKVISKDNPSTELTATITGKDTVTVSYTYALAGVAYNTGNYGYYFGETLNLCNSAGIPAGAFILNR